MSQYVIKVKTLDGSVFYHAEIGKINRVSVLIQDKSKANVYKSKQTANTAIRYLKKADNVEYELEPCNVTYALLCSKENAYIHQFLANENNANLILKKRLGLAIKFKSESHARALKTVVNALPKAKDVKYQIELAVIVK